MKVRDEIDRYAIKEDRPILNWLLNRYHWSSQWSFVARCTFEGKYPNSHRIWEPTNEGRILYYHEDIS